MLQIPEDVAERFETALQGARIADALRPHLRKWLRYYLDFCTKYGFDPADEASSAPSCGNRVRPNGNAGRRFDCTVGPCRRQDVTIRS